MTGTFYPRLRDGLELHRTAAQAMILAPMAVPGWNSDELPASVQPLNADGYLVDFLALLDGAASIEDLIDRFTVQYGRAFGALLARQALSFAAERDDLVVWSETPAAQPRRPRFTGSENGFFPLHATVEIIETCNFTCAHCYYRSSPFKTGRLSLEQAQALFDTLADNGVRVVELTGGECTIHPDFREILAYASRRFAMVAVISNGYRLGGEGDLAAFAAGFPNTVFQISIDAIGERHDRFRKHRGAFDAAVRAVERLVAARKLVRISSSISHETVDQVLPLYELGKRLGATRHSFAPISSIGRGCNVTDPSAGARELVEAINKILAPHATEPAINPRNELPAQADAAEEIRNCGAGWRTVAIDYEANVRACNFSRDSKKLGNLLEDEYRAVFEQPAQFLFNNAPSPGGRDCFGCRYYDYCKGCFVKAFTLSEREYPECAWRRRWFPGMALGPDPDRFAARSLEEKRAMLPRYSDSDSPLRCGRCEGCGGAGASPGACA